MRPGPRGVCSSQTFVIVTHDPTVGAACDRIIRMRDGRVAGEERRLAGAERPLAAAACVRSRDPGLLDRHLPPTRYVVRNVATNVSGASARIDAP